MRTRTLVGLILTLSGLGCFGAGAMILTQALDTQAITAEQVRKAEVACREQLVRVGRVTFRENEIVEIEISDAGDPRRALADATAALAMCPARQIVDACLGVNCSGKGGPGPVKMVLRMGLLK